MDPTIKTNTNTNKPDTYTNPELISKEKMVEKIVYYTKGTQKMLKNNKQIKRLAIKINKGWE
jgi:hypothetical protein